MNKKVKWSQEAKERAVERLKQAIRDPKTPSSYYKKQQLLDNIKEDFPRY